MASINLNGMGVALVTPFKADNSIDIPALGQLIDHQIRGGADFLVVLGTTAETPTLTATERIDVQHFVAEHTAGRVPLVIGKGGNCTASVIDEISHGDLSGYSAILSVAPYYNKPSQEGLFRHFTAIADNSPLPIILYNVPGRTGVNLSAATTLRLATHPNITAIKEASGNISQAAEIIKQAPEGFSLLSGDDGITLPLLSLGAKGVISVLGNAYPAAFSQMVHTAIAGDMETARRLHHKLSPLFSLLFTDGNPAGIKCLLQALGYCKEQLRLPLTEVSADTRQKIDRFVAQQA